MRLFAVVVAICALSQGAVAQTSECKKIADPAARLTCYDKATPVSAVTPAARHVATGKSSRAKVDSGEYVDAISAEDALMNARLRNICRGC
jgi:hypothetical protein